MIAASAGGLSTFMLRSNFSKEKPFYDVCAMCNGILGGLVGITAPCGNVTNGSAIVIGAIGGVFYHFVSRGITAAKIDDPLDAFAVHCGAGIWGILSAGLFDRDSGLFYGHGIKQLWVQFYGGVLIFIWTVAWAGAIFFTLKVTGLLRISQEEE